MLFYTLLTNQNNNWRPKRYGSTLKSSAKLCDMKYCPICSYTSTEALELRCHMASHVSFQPPFNCPVCYKTFSNKYNVQTHMVIHTGERPFECNICFKSFKQKSHMHAHQRNTHSVSIS
ncbi:zinc finger and BTB domain-containing protein 7A [Trichonephila inaurata madagascariensis]|uniref:Zinc finger and BTB domain-containing protein 7A n=1 Tax=Trichonephila inaurata madagascariensis TaxID=2747483 RepID=A0A8X6XVS9_9ARAC|nr:zinc finger and BTB domain-containing protein 7A [Trichonephila inaurata madagascariensis]